MGKITDFSHIKKTDFSDLLGLNRSAASRHAKNGNITTNPDGTIDATTALTRTFIARRTLAKREPSKERRAKAQRLLKRIETAAPHPASDVLDDVLVDLDSDALPVPCEGGSSRIFADAALAEAQITIDRARITSARATREELELSVYKHELAPMSLMAYWYSFAEAMITRQYARFGEIFPQLEALVKGGDSRSALQLLRREQEAIVKKATQDLIDDITKEGYGNAD